MDKDERIEILDQAVREAFKRFSPSGTMLIRWSLVLDSLDEDEDRSLATVWPVGMVDWEAIGMLQAALWGTQMDYQDKHD